MIDIYWDMYYHLCVTIATKIIIKLAVLQN